MTVRLKDVSKSIVLHGYDHTWLRRSDVDGLRAVAVASVIFFHFQMFGFGGGYVGVDVFFVISGFLITGIIYSEVSAGSFNLGGFYRRRVQRLFPALAVASLVTFLASLVVLVPAEMEEFAGSVVAALSGWSNVFFWNESGYFDSEAYFKPLLHTWSLGVEAQFYLVWPFIVVLLMGRPFWILAAIVGLCALASFGANLAYVSEVETIFYLPQFRVFEFAIGAGTFLASTRLDAGRWISNVCVVLGISMILVAAMAFDKHTIFPAHNALLPCAGAALVIFGGRSADAAALLRHRAVVRIGLISYSLYLFHWPIYSLYRYWHLSDPSLAEKLALIALSVAAAELSYRYVETPFRNSAIVDRFLINTRQYVPVAGVGAALLVASIYAWQVSPFAWRLSRTERLYYAQIGEDALADCRETELFRNLFSNCAFAADKGEQFDVVLIGDSHARVMRPGLVAPLEARGLSGVWVGAGSTVPLIDAVKVDDGKPEPRRTETFNAIYEAVLRAKPKIVILMARWELAYTTFRPFGDGRRFVHYKGHEENTPESSQAALRAAFSDTIETLNRAGIAVVAISSIPTVAEHVPTCLFRFREANCNFASVESILRDNEGFNRFARELIGESDQNYWIEITDKVCPPSRERCQVSGEEGLFFVDPSHFSVRGAKWFFDNAMKTEFEAMLTKVFGPSS